MSNNKPAPIKGTELCRAVIPFYVLLNQNLSANEIRLYGLVEQFESCTGKVFFGNQYVADILGVDPRSIRRMREKLEQESLIERTYDNNKKQWLWRTLKPGVIVSEESGEDTQCPGGEDTQRPPKSHNNISNIINNNSNIKYVGNNNNDRLGKSLLILSQDNNFEFEDEFLTDLIKRHGFETVQQQIKNLEKQANIKNPAGWLRKACQSGYKMETKPSPKPKPSEARKYHQPTHTPSFREMLSEWLKLSLREKVEVAREAFMSADLYKSRLTKLDETEDYVNNLPQRELEMVVEQAHRLQKICFN